MNVTKIGRRGQIILPLAIRQWLSLQEGDRIAFVRKGNDVVLQPMKQTLLDLRGSVPVSGPQNFSAVRKQVIESHTQTVIGDED